MVIQRRNIQWRKRKECFNWRITKYGIKIEIKIKININWIIKLRIGKGCNRKN